MQIGLELLAPAKNADIGITAIDCGADAVYIAGPAFGARVAAGNSVEEVARLCRHAHLYGARVHATVNTLLRKDEISEAEDLMWALHEAGVDAFLIQDLNLLSLQLPPVELHASTQTAIRTPERARELEALGFRRLVLERALSLRQIREIREAVDCELEFFIHGALCVGYSGQCYLSQYLTERSANRGACAQPCRSRYDLVDSEGRVLEHDRPLLSPKDLRFDRRIADLVDAGITSFKIEGRLKNASYVRNIVRHYRAELDGFIASHPDYRKTSAGNVEGGFTSDPDRTFSRGWTEAFLDGRTAPVSSGEAAKALGEPMGEIRSVRGRTITLSGVKTPVNGDGLSFVSPDGEVSGMRVETVEAERISLKDTTGLVSGMKVFRSYDLVFERELEKNLPKRVMEVDLVWGDAGSEPGMTKVSAVTEDGLKAELAWDDDAPEAEKPDAARDGIRRQLEKHTGPFVFTLKEFHADPVRFYPAAFLNGIRREISSRLEKLAQERPRPKVQNSPKPDAGRYNDSTLELPEVLMRCKYCIRWETGRCRVKPGVTARVTRGPDPGSQEPLWLVNQGRRLRLEFDCQACEMVVKAERKA